MLYVNGMTITIAAGGAVSDSRESFLTKDASKVEGRCLDEKKSFGKETPGEKDQLTSNLGKAQ